MVTSRNPVLLLHGLDDTGLIFGAMVPYLRALGWPVHAIDLIPSNGDVGLEVLAQQVADYVERTFAPEQAIDLLGFSMGGIVGRYYVQRLGGLQRIHRFVTIASPHQGTWTALLRPNLGAMQMRPNSPFLLDLQRDVERLEQINVTSIWSPLDLIIVPSYSSLLPVGKNIQVWVGGHAWMVTEPSSLQAVVEALSEPLRVSAVPLAVCAELTDKSLNRFS